MKFTHTLLLILIAMGLRAQETKPLRIGIAGLTHTHVHWLLGSNQRDEFEIVGIAEPDREVALRYLKQYNLSEKLLFRTLEEMIESTKPEAVTAFNSIFQHLEVVKICAPKKIHVMVEKPLAVSLDHAKQMEALAKKHGIHLLTNYETTWYKSNHDAFSMITKENAIGQIRKIVVHDGHPGPKEIGVSKEFLDWLTDPVQNGGGALMDFGCYGANMLAWLMNNERPESVMAITQTFKPDIYSKVDDEATIVVTYPKVQGIIQASWNWPYNRKDMEVYGVSAYLKADRNSLRFRKGDEPEMLTQVETRPAPFDNPFAFFAGVIRGTIPMDDHDLSSLPLNMIAMEILDAASQSAKQGKRIYLKK
ncbi:MAG TPA: Gfo/Idh/MocA family oxidoreductase [Chryseosolibacter sp.]